ncbi:MAG: SCO family protein [Bacillota bacterium]|nr:MAG: SCO family protein [Bacillota bacterium]
MGATTAPLAHRRTRRFRRGTWLPLALLAMALVLAGCGSRRETPESVQPAESAQSEDLPRYRPAPAFTLTDQMGRRVSTEGDLKGKVLLVNFIFTHCTDTCPLQTAQMAHLQRQLVEAGITPDQLRLVSISVDPVRDTPEVLRRYAESYDADPAYWHFLTGPVEEVRQVVVEGFKIPAQIPDHHQHGHGEGLIAHSDLTVLVDRQGQVRAYYPIEVWDWEKVLADVRRVLAEP